MTKGETLQLRPATLIDAAFSYQTDLQLSETLSGTNQWKLYKLANSQLSECQDSWLSWRWKWIQKSTRKSGDAQVQTWQKQHTVQRSGTEQRKTRRIYTEGGDQVWQSVTEDQAWTGSKYKSKHMGHTLLNKTGNAKSVNQEIKRQSQTHNLIDCDSIFSKVFWLIWKKAAYHTHVKYLILLLEY